jgi:hypothetical protein
MKMGRVVMTAAVLLAVSGGVVLAAYESEARGPVTLAAYAPPGALMVLESDDFAGLLKSWNGSEEQKRWLKSANYAGFANSRLFSSLSRAQDEYASLSGVGADGGFLEQVAGGESLFAWYDISKLQFLYVTKMAPGEVEKIPLLALKGEFEQRKVGDAVFYVKADDGSAGDASPAAQADDGQDASGGAQASGGDAASAAGSAAPASGAYQAAGVELPTMGSQAAGQGQTVAFAVRGDYVILGTREDLVAGALELMQKAEDRTLEHDVWYAQSVAAAGKRGDLRMELNMSAIVKQPTFRSYWVQQNITEMKQYSAVESDLYREGGQFREERVLVRTEAAATPAMGDLSGVTAYVPAGMGVYRAVAAPGADEVVAQMEDKLLSRQALAYRDPHEAPVANLATPVTGDASDFEDRIDAPVVEVRPRGADVAMLRGLVTGEPVTAMLVMSTAQGEAGDEAGMFWPMHAGVVLESATPWKEAAVEDSVRAAVAARVSVGERGLNWTAHTDAHGSWVELSGMSGVAMAVRGKECIVATDAWTLGKMLQARAGAKVEPRVAAVVAGFSQAGERVPMERLVNVLDRQKPVAKPSPGPYAADAAVTEVDGQAPAFFSQDMASLSDSFRDLDTETFVAAAGKGLVTRQTVVYAWRH